MLKEMRWNFNFQTQFSATSYFLYIISSCGFILGLFGCRSFWFALTYAWAIHNNQVSTKKPTGASGGGVGVKISRARIRRSAFAKCLLT